MFYNPAGVETAYKTNIAAPNNTIYSQKYDYVPPAWNHKSNLPAHKDFYDVWTK